ncbi:unnamed protein product [Owenia fusiformis]|uniref:Uncharacterized protein n=1 Tax=Owenia fusiformis TaxID=6347 RepID=A0A8J1UEW0_OWEFU|nr:unnamed protein product [Owenia fusiformis]
MLVFQNKLENSNNLHTIREEFPPKMDDTGEPGRTTIAVANKLVHPKRPMKTALHQAVLDGRLHQVRLLVNKHGANVDSKDYYGRTAFMLTTFLDNVEYGLKMAKVLLKAGAFLNLKDNMNRSALSYACMKGRAEILKKLLKEDILDINDPDNDGNSPLHHAVLCGDPEVVRILVNVIVKFGLPVDIRNNIGYTPLLLSCKYGHYASAYHILTLASPSPTLRDNEFYLNAKEWVQKSYEIRMQQEFRKSRSQTMPCRLPLDSLLRESTQGNLKRGNTSMTMYQRSWTPQCNHVKGQTDPFASALNADFRLPSILPSFSIAGDESLEATIDGQNSRDALMLALEDSVEQQDSANTRSISRSLSVRSRSSITTAKLRQLGRSKTSLVPLDLGTLFKMYSEQHYPEFAPIQTDRHNVNKHIPVIISTAPSARPSKAHLEDVSTVLSGTMN